MPTQLCPSIVTPKRVTDNLPSGLRLYHVLTYKTSVHVVTDLTGRENTNNTHGARSPGLPF